MNCSSDLKIFANSQTSATNCKSFSLSLEHFFLTVGQDNFGKKNAILPSIFIPEKLYYHCTVQNGTEVFSCLPKADSANMMIPGVQIVQLKAKHEYQIAHWLALVLDPPL